MIGNKKSSIGMLVNKYNNIADRYRLYRTDREKILSEPYTTPKFN